MLLSNIRSFISGLDFLISKSFFYLQCSFRLIILDYFKTLFKKEKFTKDFKILRGDLPNIESNYNFETDTNQKILFSDLIVKNELDKNVNEIIKTHYKEIVNYLGRSFLHDQVKIYRNYNFPEKFHDYDVFANIWHQDTHDGKRLLKIFVLLEDVDESCGPLVFLDRLNTKKNWKLIKERYRTHNVNSRVKIENQIKFTGKKGDYLIVDTSNCMHRAGIPEIKRDMMQITLYPNWMNKDGREIYKF